MTHAWLFTGPPGSGRSLAARAFAAALLCDRNGCGECPSCRQVAAGTHADLLLVRPDGLSYGVKQTRDLVLKAAASPVYGGWRIVLFEDADRATEQAANALLKAIEEPSPRTVWLLCAPYADDLPTTIRSRCRYLVTSCARRSTSAVAGSAGARGRAGRAGKGRGTCGPRAHRPRPAPGNRRGGCAPARRGAAGARPRRQPRRGAQGSGRAGQGGEGRGRTATTEELRTSPGARGAPHAPSAKARPARAWRPRCAAARGHCGNWKSGRSRGRRDSSVTRWTGHCWTWPVITGMC